MKTELELEFKKETGFRPSFRMTYCPACGEPLSHDELYQTEFVDFLIERIEKLTKELSEISYNYKDEYEDAQNEIGELQDQLSDAEDEIRELKYKE